jgi:cephalosporin-C deacetylase
MPFPDLAPDVVADYHSPAKMPADFKAFWDQTLAETRSHPLDVRFDPVAAGLPLFDVYDLTFRGYGGHPVRGWFIAPKSGARSCVVKFIGYNGGRSFAHEHLFWPATGRAVLVMDTRGQGSGWAPGHTPDPVGSDPAHSGFMTRGIQRREDYFYRRVFTDAVRAVEAAKAFPGIDPTRISVTGGSQGGGISLAVAGLVPGLAAVMPDVPYLCDFYRGVTMATRDPYLEIPRYLAVHRWAEETVFATLNNFDGVHFSTLASAPALFSVGLMDTICPPSTVYAAFNAYAGAKEMVRYTFNDHEGGGPFQMERQKDWLDTTCPA